MAIANLQPLSEIQFYAQLRTFIGQVEGKEPAPYYDTKGIPTIGIGFNLDEVSKRVFDVMLIGEDDPIRDALKAIINDPARRARALAAKTKTERDAISQEMQDALNKAYGQSFIMSPDQIETLFKSEALSRVSSVKTLDFRVS